MKNHGFFTFYLGSIADVSAICRGINMKYKKEVFRSLALITQLGIHVMVPIFMCLFIGYIIDKKFGTSTILAFLIVGMLAGGRNAYMLAKGVIGENERDKK